MPTGMGYFDCVLAVVALQNHQIAALAATTPQCPQRLAMAGQQLIAVQSFQFPLAAFNHLR